MIKEIAWDVFKNTGNINTFLEFKEIENIENDLLKKSFEQDERIDKDM